MAFSNAHASHINIKNFMPGYTELYDLILKSFNYCFMFDNYYKYYKIESFNYNYT